MNGKTVGDIGEVRVLFEFIKLGISVFLPYGENTKKDIIAEFNGKLNKIQIKTVSLLNDNEVSYTVSLKNTSLRSDGKHIVSIPSKEDIDYYAIYCLERERPLLIPFSLVEGQTSVTIRFDNTNYQNSIYEQDFFFEKVTKNEEIIKLIQKKYSNRVKNFCIDCGNPISKDATRCKKCANSYNRNRSISKLEKNNITREELKEMIRTESFLSIGKRFEVSDNAIRKWCVRYNLPKTKKEILNFSDEEWKLI